MSTLGWGLFLATGLQSEQSWPLSYVPNIKDPGLLVSDKKIFMSPHHGGWGDIVFSEGPVGISIASCLHSIFLLNGQILAKLTQIYHWEGENAE